MPKRKVIEEEKFVYDVAYSEDEEKSEPEISPKKKVMGRVICVAPTYIVVDIGGNGLRIRSSKNHFIGEEIDVG